jgi:hypothetical protein
MMAIAQRLLFWTMLSLLLLSGACTSGDDPGSELSDSSAANASAPVTTAATGPTTTLRSRLGDHIDSLVLSGGTRSRVVFTPGNEWSVEFIRRRFAASGAAVEIDSFPVKVSDGKTRSLSNVIATVPGRDDSIVVICAHLDASASRDRGWRKSYASMPAPGAVDNATGVAALIELVALVKSAPTPPRHTLLFIACNAEELNPRYRGHHLGSRHAAERLKREQKGVAAVISIDMAGYSPRGNRIGLFATGKGEKLARRLAALKDSLGVQIELPRSYGPCRNSDNESFERLGYPTVLFMENCRPWHGSEFVPRNPGYHSGRDLPGLVNRDVLEGVVRVVSAFVR